MKLGLVLSILAPASLALAQPAGKPAPLCVPSSANTFRVAAVGADVITCFIEDDKPERCIAVSSKRGPRKVRPPAASAPAPAAKVRGKGGKLSACMGKTCVKLGKNLTAAIAGVDTKNGEGGGSFDRDAVPHPTTNLEVVVIQGKPWSVRDDKALVLTPPREYAKRSDVPPGSTGVDVAGDLLIANWADCAGPCAMAAVIDASGATKGDWFPAGKPLALDAKRVAIIPDDSDAILTVLDPVTAKQLGTLQLADGVLLGLQAARVDAKTIAAVWHEEAWKVVWISVPPTGSPSITTTKEIATCP